VFATSSTSSTPGCFCRNRHGSREEILADGCAGTEHEAPALQPFQISERTVEIFGKPEDLVRVRLDDFSRRRELQPASHPVEERYPKRTFKLCDLLGNRRLAHVQDFGRPGDPAQPHGGLEELEVVVVRFYNRHYMSARQNMHDTSAGFSLCRLKTNRESGIRFG
jgi:hypothetical protein